MASNVKPTNTATNVDGATIAPIDHKAAYKAAQANVALLRNLTTMTIPGELRAAYNAALVLSAHEDEDIRDLWTTRMVNIRQGLVIEALTPGVATSTAVNAVNTFLSGTHATLAMALLASTPVKVKAASVANVDGSAPRKRGRRSNEQIRLDNEAAAAALANTTTAPASAAQDDQPVPPTTAPTSVLD